MLGLFTSRNLRSDLVKSTKQCVRQLFIHEMSSNSMYSGNQTSCDCEKGWPHWLLKHLVQSTDHTCHREQTLLRLRLHSRRRTACVQQSVYSRAPTWSQQFWSAKSAHHLQTASGEINLTALQDCNHKQWPHSWFMVAECYAYCQPHRVKPL